MKETWQRCRSEIAKLPVYERNLPLCERVITTVLPAWAACYGEESPVWSKIRKKFAKEFNETEPAISFIMNQVDNNKADDGRPFVIVDVCSGFGIASMLLSEVLDASKVKCIWLLDKQWPSNPHDAAAARAKPKHISTSHIMSRSSWPIPLRTRQVDMKRSRDKNQLPKYVYGDFSRVIFLGIHLCKKLAVHAINLFSSCDNASSLVLKPCCLPGTQVQHLYIRKKPIVYEFENGYSFRLVDLLSTGDNNNDDNKTNVSDDEQVEAIPTRTDSDGDCGCDHSGGYTDNVRFSQWVQHLECGCRSDTCRVRRETIQIQRHHFQNQFLFCERLAA